MEIVRMSWIGRNLQVIDSSDSSLLDVAGTVVNESKNMLVIRSNSEIEDFQVRYQIHN